MELTRGMRDKLCKYINISDNVTIDMMINGSSVYDYCCFGVDVSGKLSDDRYMIFYNQISSPGNEIVYRSDNNSAQFVINLDKIPLSIDKLVFTASIDGNGTMGDITSHVFSISQNGTKQLVMKLDGLDFKQEKAIISVEIYRKGEWRINAVASGFNGGLSALLAKYGGTELTNTVADVVIPNMPNISNSVTNSESTILTSEDSLHGGIRLKKNEEELTKELMGKINLTKDKVNLEKHVVSLSKTVVNLSKKNGVDLGATRAKVVVALDYSGSMSTLYSNGTVQKTINKLVPLGLTFDDNGSIDVYLFQSDYRKMDDLDLSNYESYISSVVKKSGYTMGGTNYAPVIKAIIDGDFQHKKGFWGIGGQKVFNKSLVDSGTPTFILFITDGVNADKTASDAIIRKSSEMNVFIQFIGIGNEKFDYLMKLDDMPGRTRDNTGFSKMKDLNKASDEELYTNVLEQFSQWIKGLQ